jgi:hypothetical protein
MRKPDLRSLALLALVYMLRRMNTERVSARYGLHSIELLFSVEAKP